MQLDRREIESSLARKGFVGDRSSHHRYFHHQCDGKRTGIYTYISHGPSYKVYGDALLSEMKKQLRLDAVGQLVDLVKCPMSAEQYNAVLRKKRLF